jgi:hypothetical protein
MLDNAMLNDIVEKNGAARRQTGGRGSPVTVLHGEPAAGVPGDRRGSQLGPVAQPAAGRRDDPRSLARACRRAPALRLSAPPNSASPHKLQICQGDGDREGLHMNHKN